MAAILSSEEKAALVAAFFKEKEDLNNQAKDLAKEMASLIDAFQSNVSKLNKKQLEIIQKQIAMDISLEDSFNPSIAKTYFGRNIFNIKG